MSTAVYINGRFLTQPVTGVQRFAREVLKALGSLAPVELASVVLLAPRNAVPDSAFGGFRVRKVGRLTGHAWEQIELPFYARGGVLVNLCNTAPIVKRRQLVVMHDAGVFTLPGVYGAAFRWWYRIMFVLIARFSRQVATVSEFSQTELSRHLRVPRQRFKIVPEAGDHILGVTADHEVLARHDLADRRFVLAVSSLSPHKNFQAVVRSIERLEDLDCDFVIAGGVNPRVFATDPAQFSARVHYIGYVTDPELRALYERAACLVYPSIYEGFGLPPLEAMACGCPVIVARAASLPEVCGTAAVYCDPFDPSDIARCVRGLLSDVALRDDLSRKGRDRAKEFSWLDSARQVAHLVSGVSRRDGSATSSGR